MTKEIIKRSGCKQPLAPVTRMALPIRPISQKPAAALSSVFNGLPKLASAVKGEEIDCDLGELQRRPPFLVVRSVSKLPHHPKSKATEREHTPAAMHSARNLLAAIVAEAMRLQNNQSV